MLAWCWRGHRAGDDPQMRSVSLSVGLRQRCEPDVVAVTQSTWVGGASAPASRGTGLPRCSRPEGAQVGKWLSFIGSSLALAIMTIISVGIGYACKSVPDALKSSLPVGQYLGVALMVYFGVKTLRARALPSPGRTPRGRDTSQRARWRPPPLAPSLKPCQDCEGPLVQDSDWCGVDRAPLM